MTWTFKVPFLWAGKNLAPILDAAKRSGDSVLAQVRYDTLPNEPTPEQVADFVDGDILIRLVIVPENTIPKVFNLIERDRAKMEGKKAEKKGGQ